MIIKEVAQSLVGLVRSGSHYQPKFTNPVISPSLHFTRIKKNYLDGSENPPALPLPGAETATQLPCQPLRHRVLMSTRWIYRTVWSPWTATTSCSCHWLVETRGHTTCPLWTGVAPCFLGRSPLGCGRCGLWTELQQCGRLSCTAPAGPGPAGNHICLPVKKRATHPKPGTAAASGQGLTARINAEAETICM